MPSLKDQLLKSGLASSADAERAAREKVEAAETAHTDAEETEAAAHGAKARAYPNARLITLAETRSLFDAQADRLHAAETDANVDGVLDMEIFTLPSVQVVEGDLALDELVLEAEGSNLLVKGNVRIAGTLRQEFRAGGLVVFGNLTAKNVVTTGSILVFGDLDVPGTLFGNCTNYETDVLGHANVGTLISAKEHLFAFWATYAVTNVVDVRGGTPNLDLYGGEEKQLRADVNPFEEKSVARSLAESGSLLAD